MTFMKASIALKGKATTGCLRVFTPQASGGISLSENNRKSTATVFFVRKARPNFKIRVPFENRTPKLNYTYASNQAAAISEWTSRNKINSIVSNKKSLVPQKFKAFVLNMGGN